MPQRLNRCLAAGAAVIVVMMTTASPVFAFELFGVRFFGSEPELQEGEVRYETAFSADTDDRDLTRSLRAASSLIDDEGDPSPGAAALIATARADYQRLLGTLYGAGRYGGAISITINGREAADLPLDTDLGTDAVVDIAVRPGPIYLFDDISVVERPGPIVNDLTVPPTPEELGLVPGGEARSGVIVGAESAVLGRWRERGHPLVTSERNVRAYHDRDAIDVDIRVDPGPEADFGETTVTGTERMDPEFVAYYADIPPGSRYDPDIIERAENQLRRLEVFQAQRIVEAERLSEDGTLPIEIKVAERKRRVIGAGAKFSTLDGAGLEGYWRHRNLFGRAEQLRLDARVSGISADNPDEYNYRVGASFLKPGVFTPYTDFLADVYGEQTSPDTYRARTIGGRIGLAHRITERLTVEAYGNVEVSTIDRTNVGDGEFVFLSVPVSLTYNSTDNDLDPTQGFRVKGTVEPFYEANFANFGAVTELEASTYYGLADDRVILAARAQVASIAGAPLDETPANRLYFAGGGGSIRGYEFEGVGPRDAFGNIVGGRSLFTASAEARVRVTQSFGVVPFVDVGNAFSDEIPDFSEPLKVGVGVGIRYYTGLGPLRVDFAVPLDPPEGDPNFAFYVGLGQAF